MAGISKQKTEAFVAILSMSVGKHFFTNSPRGVVKDRQPIVLK
jgi:hypothetical protein